ncbi:hypothetical protein ACIK7D_18525 [Agrobacterium sp. P15N1-A]
MANGKILRNATSLCCAQGKWNQLSEITHNRQSSPRRVIWSCSSALAEYFSAFTMIPVSRNGLFLPALPECGWPDGPALRLSPISLFVLLLDAIIACQATSWAIFGMFRQEKSAIDFRTNH